MRFSIASAKLNLSLPSPAAMSKWISLRMESEFFEFPQFTLASKINFHFRFVFFGGNISGKFTEIIPSKKIAQTWRYKQWPDGHFSNVEMEFEEKDDHTVLKLKQTLVPTNEYETTNQNWQRYYFESIRQTFGFGSFLY